MEPGEEYIGVRNVAGVVVPIVAARVREHEHYCAEHDHRWHCRVDPCTLPVAYACDLCRCGQRLLPASDDPRLLSCRQPRVEVGGPGRFIAAGFLKDGHDSLLIETTRRV